MTEALPNQSQQTGNNTVIVSDTLGNIGGGQIGDGSNGIGDTYLGRLLIIDQNTGSEQIRLCIGDAAGTGTTRILTVSEDWDVNPVITTDTVYVPYEFGDIEDGGVGNGINLNSKSGLWELSNTLEVLSTGVLQGIGGQGMELDDQGSTYAFQIQSGGFFYAGYPDSGADISGIQITAYNNAAGEASVEVLSGGHLHMWDTLIWGQLVAQTFDVQDGGEGYFRRCKWLSMTQELILYDSDIGDCAAAGRAGGTAEIVRVDVGTVCDGFVLSNLDTLDCRADTVTETLTLSNVQFVQVTDFINVRNNKTWEMIDPIWPVTDYTDFVWVGSTSNEVNDRRSVTATVQEADGTKLENAVVNIYEDTQLADLVLELSTDVDGLAADSFIYRKHATNSVTTTYGGHALQVGKWLYEPFVAAQASDEKFLGTVVLSPDNNIVETTQATAKSDGSTITWNEDTNPSELIAFTAGSGTLAAGMIVTFSPSGAVGTITFDMSGDSVAGEFHMSDRNATAIGATDTFTRTGGTAGSFSGTYTNTSKQPFAIWVDGQNLGLQAVYDWMAAITTETTLTAAGEIIWEWCRSAQGQALYHTGSSFFTERSNSKGIIIVDGGAGTQDYYTDDAGTQWIPPVTRNFKFTLNPSITGYEWRIYEASGTPGDGTIGTVELDGEEVSSADNQTYIYVYSADQDIAVQILTNGYEEFLHYDTLLNSNKDLTFNLTPETNT